MEGFPVITSKTGELAGPLVFPCPELDEDSSSKFVGQWSEYGESLDLLRFGQGPSPTSILTEKKEEEVIQAPAELLDSTNSKIVSTELSLELRCQVRSIDYQGRSDGRSVKTILKQMLPQRVVVVHGTTEATELLKKFCESSLSIDPTNVHAPQQLEPVRATSAVSVRQVLLSQDLLAKTEMHTLKVGLHYCIVMAELSIDTDSPLLLSRAGF